MRLTLACLFCSVTVLSAQTPAKTPAVGTMLHVFASSGALSRGLTEGTRITGTLDGQTLVLHTFQQVNPLQPGDYPIRLKQDKNPHGAELDRSYTLTMPDGKEVLYLLEAVCESGVTTCYGVSVK